MSDQHEIDRTIARYRAELRAEADLGGAELDEIEDHLRSLTVELRDRGMPAADAIAEAARRLGDPRALASEASRVRTSFGARLSRGRALGSAAVHLVALALIASVALPREGLLSLAGLELSLGAVGGIALALRLSWARPALLGAFAFLLLLDLVQLSVGPAFLDLPKAGWHLTMFTLLAPWRRGELRAPGLALAVLVPGIYAAMFASSWTASAQAGLWKAMPPVAELALVLALVSMSGLVIRARWAALTAACSSVALVGVLGQLQDIRGHGAHPELMRMVLLAPIALGALGTAVAAVLAWRTARSHLGTLRAILR